MKTASLSKAPVGHVKVVIEPNREGYEFILDVPLGKNTLGDLFIAQTNELLLEREKREALELEVGSLKEQAVEHDKRVEELENQVRLLISYGSEV